ncbi:MAG: cytochrome C oxidase subunit IV family protein [Pseudomonadota bacterium]
MSGDHSSVRTYWKICVILSLMTLAEYLIFKVPSLRGNPLFMVPVLSVLSIVKFVLVLGWYMHLKYDNKILTKIFAGSLAMAVMVFVILKLALHP